MRDAEWHRQIAEAEAQIDALEDQDAAETLRKILEAVKSGAHITPEQCERFGIPISKDASH